MTEHQESIQMQIKLSKLEGRIEHLETKADNFFSEIRSELKDIKAHTSVLSGIVIDSNYHKDSLSRAFERIEKLENKEKDFDAYINKIEGAKRLAYVLWTIMGTSVGAVVLKMFFGN